MTRWHTVHAVNISRCNDARRATENELMDAKGGPN